MIDNHFFETANDTGSKLNLSDVTISHRWGAIRKKFGVENNTQLYLMALRDGELSTENGGV